jgi:two-component system CheB/CheR fusion protein
MKEKKGSKKASSKTARQEAKTARKSKPFPIVAIGASAGGLEAMTTFLDALPADTGMAYVYVQHLDPSHESMLPEILAWHTKMTVLHAKHLLPIKKNHLFIIPPNKNMAIIDGVLTLKPREAKPSIHMPIDKFFISLAEKQKDGAIGIVLSGNANDGTLGLRAIKTAGGFTFAQDESAKFQSMPKSAFAEGVVDMVLPPKKIAEELRRISANKDFITKVFSEDVADDLPVEDFDAIISLLKKATGVDFKNYKVNTIQRRILRRLLLQKFETLKEYARYLKQNTNEIQALYQDLLINVTAFFRDPDAVEYLKKTILPKILKSKKASEATRMWVPACSSGEEAYSLAMILTEIAGDSISHTPIQIFASDLSDQAIAKARIGLYSKADLQGVTPKRLQRFFTKIDGGYRIVKSIRDLCVFAPHNILRDPPFSKLDLISCCNLMIYFDQSLQSKILHTFHYALNPMGYLVLGKSETINSAGELFNQIEKKYKVYTKKKDSSSKARFELRFPIPDRENGARPLKVPARKPAPSKGDHLEKSVDDMLQKYIPSSVVVNEDFEILQFRGSTSLFLEHSSGKASLNLLKMARPGLSFELRSAVHKSTKSGHPVKKSDIEIKFKGHHHKVSIEVSPIKTATGEKIFLIVFEEVPSSVSGETRLSGAHDKIVKQLEQEIEILKEDMRSMLEDQEANVEELQSANEEIVSANEELQSINEELETSKEEVESANEELTTINNELLQRNEQLSESYEYSEAVFGTIREAVIVLDRNLRVKNANTAFYQIFNVSEEETIGKLVHELGNRQWNIPKLRQMLEDIVNQGNSFHGFEVQHQFPHIGQKTMLINARSLPRENNHNLVLVAIEDISEHRHAQKLMEERESWFRNMANQAPVMIWVCGSDKRINFFNETWIDFTGKKIQEAMGYGWQSLVHRDDLPVYLEIFNEHFDKRLPFFIEYRLRRKDGAYRWIMDAAKPTFLPDGSFSGYIGSSNEIHDKKLIQHELELQVNQRTADLLQLNAALQRSNGELQQFAYVASHDLQEPLRKILTFVDRLKRMDDVFPPAVMDYLEKIAVSSEKMRKLIDELLKFSRTTQLASFSKVNLNEIVKNVFADFEIIVSEKKAVITFDNLPSIDAIPVQMEQLFHNLISNALKFSVNKMPPHIHIGIRNPDARKFRALGLDDSQPYAYVTVSDNGIGFGVEYAEQIFDIFQRLNYRQEFPGTGIGLALCRKIVDNHKGKIFAEGVVDKGAIVHVILPINQNQNLVHS